MPFNILLLPLLGGFVFISFWNRTRWYAQRAEKERLLLYAFLAGVVFIGISILILSVPPFVPCVDALPCLPVWWAKHIPFRYSDISVLTLFLGITTWWPLNRWWFDERTEWARVIRDEGGPLENALYQSLVERKWVMITLKNGKVYIGPVGIGFTPEKDKTIYLVPFRSGYRNPATMWLEITTDYEDVYEKIKQSESDYENIIADFGVVIPVSEILSASLYRKDIHVNYFPPPVTSQPVTFGPLDMD